MRRFRFALRAIAASLTVVLLLQSSGAALAANAQIIPQFSQLSLSMQIASTLQSLRATKIAAMLTGNADQWNAMHAPAPVFPRETSHPRVNTLVDRHQQAVFHAGIFRSGPPMLDRRLRPDELSKDPRAMSYGDNNSRCRFALHAEPCSTSGNPTTATTVRAPMLSPRSTPLAISTSPKLPESILLPTPVPSHSATMTAGVRMMSVPTVNAFQYEADTASAPTTLFYTYGGETGAISQTMDSEPPNSKTQKTLTYPGSLHGDSWGWISPANVPNTTSWPAQTYTVTLNISAPNANLTITEVKVYRVDANGGPSTSGLAVVGDLTGLSQSLGTAGTLSFDVAGSAQTANATDRVAVKFYVANNASTTQSFSYYVGQNASSGLNVAQPRLSASTNGINPWWTYEEGGVPGHGKYMLNVANGNMILQDDDVDIPERGIDLAFQRTYNSQSTHDSNNTDGSVPSNYGEGWTNTFDAHLAYDGSNTISVYDIDGARYDYAANGAGGWTPPPGQHATLKWDGSCGYQWTKKSGTTYYFYSPDLNETANCSLTTVGTFPQDTAYGGRLYKIWARNSNNYITFTYAWTNSNATSAANLSEIDATHADGHTLKLTFASFSGYNELASITRPDGQVIKYSYDSSGDLTDVCDVGNGNTDSSPNASTICGDAAHMHHRYGWNTPGSHQMLWADSPRWTMAWGGTTADGSGGSSVNFSYNSSNQATSVQRMGFGNFTPNDGTNSLLQPSIASGNQQISSTTFTYLSGQTQLTDTDGHAATWLYDNLGRVIEREDHTGSLWLISYASWDSSNNLIATRDPRSSSSTDTTYETDYAYDSNGNTIAVAQPTATVSVNGSTQTIHPTSLYTYDAHNNVISYCDPQSNAQNSRNWNGSGAAPSCPTISGTGAALFTWTTQTYEPDGELTSIKAPLGYTSTISYAAPPQSGTDYGLPTAVTGTSFTQQNGSNVAPAQNFAYDAYGNLACYSKLTDSSGTHWYRLTHDSMNRVTAVADPDDASLVMGQCSNTAGITGSHIQTTTSYNNDGSIATTQSPSEYASGVSTTFEYDGDGDQTSKTTHYNCTKTTCTAATTMNWYDGEDRLVEVSYPHDSTDYYSFAWLTRYLYDLTNGATVSLAASGSFKAYGNLYDVKQWLPSPACSGWTDMKGTAYDAEDRAVKQFLSTGSCSGSWAATTLTYDATTSTYGLLSSKTDPLSEVATYAYDNDGHLNSTTYSGDGGVTPSETNAFDADGRVASIHSSTLNTLYYQYDSDGRLTQTIEPGNMSSAATLNYAYYPNGLRSAISVTSTGLTQSNLMQYNYTNNGEQTSATATYGSTVAQVGWTQTPAGRVLTMTNSAGGSRQMAYDPYGRLNSDSGGPGAPYGAFTYDDEGQPLSYSAFGQTVTQAFTNRGEFQNETFSSDNSSCPSSGQYQGQQQQMADGYPVQLSIGTKPGSNCPTWTVQTIFNPLSGLMAQNGDPSTNGTQYRYDNAGRQTSASTTLSGQSCAGQVCNPYTDTGTYTKQYDAENHLISQAFSTWPQYTTSSNCPLFISNPTGNTKRQPYITNLTLTYVWGPNGHPVQAKNTLNSIAETLHWDGDSVLFTTNSSGAVDDIKLEGDADITISGGTPTVSFDNRDFTGAEGNPPSPTRQMCNWSSSAHIFSSGPDGITDGYNIFQGVRNYDPVIGTWSTPDAYQGEVGDPMSQHAYMWSRNNSFSYEDPSGYCPECWLILFQSLAPVPVAAYEGYLGYNYSFSQTWVSDNFSEPSAENTFPYAGWSLSDVIKGIANRSIPVSDLPVRVYDLNGVRYVLDNRSATALTEAGVTPNKWKIINKTGDPDARDDLLGKLHRNGIKPGQQVKVMGTPPPNQNACNQSGSPCH